MSTPPHDHHLPPNPPPFPAAAGAGGQAPAKKSQKHLIGDPLVAPVALVVGAAAGLPVGVWILVSADASVVRWFICVSVILAVAVMLSGWRYKKPPSLGVTLAAGGASGLAGGIASVQAAARVLGKKLDLAECALVTRRAGLPQRAQGRVIAAAKLTAIHRAAAQAADTMAYETFWGYDNMMPIFGDMDGPNFECYTTMAAIGAATKRIRVGALVSGVAYRNPALQIKALRRDWSPFRSRRRRPRGDRMMPRQQVAGT